MAGATAGCPHVRKSPLRAKRKSGGNGINLDDLLLRKLAYQNMNGNLPSPSYNNNGSINNISVKTSVSGASGKQFGDCISDDLGAPINTFVGSNLKRLDSNDDEGFIRGGNTNRGGFSAGKNGKSARNTGKNLMMENVTILKRGEKIEDVVGGSRSGDEEKHTLVQTSLHAEDNFLRGGSRVSGKYLHGSVSECCFDDSRRAMDKKSQFQVAVGGSKVASAPTVQKRKIKAPFRTSQVCPVSPSYDSTGKSDNCDGVGCVDELDKLGNGFMITSADRMGPDPSTILKEVSSGILRSVSTGSRFTEAINDADLPVNLPELVTRGEGGVKSGTSTASSPGLAEPPVTNSSRDWWAGPPYTNSPSPRCLPLPKFFMRHKVRSNPMGSNGLGVDEYKNNGNSIATESDIRDIKKQMALDAKELHVGITNQPVVDAFATRNLRRLLQLE